MQSAIKIILFSATTIVSLTQCRTAKMALHDEQWPAKEEYKVEGKKGIFSKEKLQFGEYHTTQVKRSWTRGTNNKFGIGEGNINSHDYTNLISIDYIKRKQTVRFSLTDAGSRESEVFCVSNFNASEVQIGNRPNSIFNIGIDVVRSLLSQPDDKYYVQIYTKAERPWELIIDNVQAQMKPKKYVGYLSRGADDYYTIVPVREMEGKDGKPQAILFGSVGFEFRNKEGKAVAAVSKIDRGIVYLQNVTAEEKFLLANACAALVLQEMIGG
jgi:hypothetical protein